MTTTRRRGHTRKVRGKTIKVRTHQVNHAQTAADLWASSGLPALFNRHAGANTLRTAADRARAGRRAAALAWGAGGLLQLGGWTLGRTSWALGLASAALVFAGIGLLVNGYRKPKPRPARKPAARAVHKATRPATQTRSTRPVQRRGATTRRASEDFGPRRDLSWADKPARDRPAVPLPPVNLPDRATLLADDDWLIVPPDPADQAFARGLGPTDRGRRRTDEVG